MAKSNEIKLNLPPLDDLFSTQESRDDANKEKVMNIPLSQIIDFPGHPFKVRNDEEMQNMSKSIEENGILVPAIVRPGTDGGYEMIAGHRRKFASGLVGLSEMPCLVRYLTDDEAVIIMVDSNLQRERILPSEKAFAYKMKLEVLQRQGERTDLTCAPLVHKLQGEKSRDIVAKEGGESREQVRRFIRLTELEPEILSMVDESKIAFRPAVELSYLPKEEQALLYETMECEDCTPSLAQAIKLKKFSQEGRLNEDVILSILSEEKPNQVEQFKMPKERIKKYFPEGTPKEKIENTIIRALDLYRKRQRDRGER